MSLFRHSDIPHPTSDVLPGSAIRNPNSEMGLSDIRHQTSHILPVLTSLLFSFLFSLSASADGPPCLPDADGDGHPIFGNPEYLVVRKPIALTKGDFDGDGDPDLAVAVSAYTSGGDGDIAILLNKGDGLYEDAPWGSDRRYAAGREPRSVCTGDFDNNGTLDLAVAAEEDFVFVLLGNGDGTFQQPPLSFPAGIGPRSVACGFVDQDQHIDLVVVNPGPAQCPPSMGTASVLLGNGDGTFAPQVVYEAGFVGDYTTGIPMGGHGHILADLDGDLDLDIAVVNSGFWLIGNTCIDSRISVLLNNGDGTYAPRVEFDTGLRPTSIAVGYIDADSHLDLVTANEQANTVSVLLGDGGGAFAPAVDYAAIGWADPGPGFSGAKPRSVALGDIDLDGDLDLAVGFLGSQRASILRNNGDGTYAPEESFDVDLVPQFADLGDLNGDGWLDLMVVTLNDEKVSILLNDGQGNLLNDETTSDGYFDDPLARAPKSLAIGDLDGDFDLDLVTANAGSGGAGSSVSVYLNDGDGTFAERVPYAAGAEPGSIAIADLDGINGPDLAVANGWNGVDNTVSVLLNNGDATFADHVPYNVGIGSKSVVIGDLDGINGLDLVVANWGITTFGSVSVLLNNGDGTFAVLPPFSQEGAWAVAVGDLDGDTRLDLVVAHRVFTNPFVSVLFGNGDGTFGAPVTYDIPVVRAKSLAIGDLDADGDLDLVVGMSNNGSIGEPNVQVFLNDGLGSLLDGGTYSVIGFQRTTSVAIGDLDGDGTPDLAVGLEQVHAVGVLKGNGDGTFGAGMAYGRGRSFDPIVVLGDMDGDGDLDLAVSNQGNDNVSILRNRTCDSEPQPCPADLDGNGEVSAFDLALLLGSWGPCEGDCPADLDGNGEVSAFDLALLLGNWGPCPACGDGSCSGSESCWNCPADCGACPIVCGDGVCNGPETCDSCADDCGACPFCGDGQCNGDDGCETCEQDCGVCACGIPGTGDCCEGNDTPFCDDDACCILVCDLDAFCCDKNWDGLCASLAEDNCVVCP